MQAVMASLLDVLWKMREKMAGKRNHWQAREVDM